MADRIVYSGDNLTDIAAEIVRLSDALSDVLSNLSGVDSSGEWWSKVNLWTSGGSCDAGTAVRTLRTKIGRANDYAEATALGVRKARSLFDDAENKVSQLARGADAGESPAVYASASGGAGGVSGLISWLWQQIKDIFSGNDQPHGGGGRTIGSTVFDDEGSYGGHQGAPRDDLRNYDEFRRLIRQNTGRELGSDAEVRAYLQAMNSEGCGYVAVCNVIFAAFDGRAAEFEQTFGFPMHADDGDFNFNMLIVDFYSATDNPQTDGTSSRDRTNSMESYLSQRGVAVDTKTNVNVTAENYAEISRNSEVVVSIYPLALRDANGEYVDTRVAGHAMTVTGVTEEGYLIVSSWGKRYYIDPNDSAFSGKDADGYRNYIRYETYVIQQ